jgi:hypothetical protein
MHVLAPPSKGESKDHYGRPRIRALHSTWVSPLPRLPKGTVVGSEGRCLHSPSWSSNLIEAGVNTAGIESDEQFFRYRLR